MKLLCVLLNYKTADMTIEALGHLVAEARTVPGARVVVVDNDSQDGSYDKIAAHVREHRLGDLVEVIASPKNGGFGFGNNVGFRRGLQDESPPEYFYIVNSDAFVQPGALRALIAYLDAHPGVGMAGSRVLRPDGSVDVSAFRFPSVWSELERSTRLGVLTRALSSRRVPLEVPSSTQEVDWISGCSMMIRRSVLEQVGMFDEHFFLYYEETDLCLRTRRAGFGIAWVFESTVTHIGGVTTGVYNTKRRTPEYIFASRRYFFLKNHGRTYLWACNLAYALGSASFRVRRVLQGKDDPDRPRELLDFVLYNLKHP